MTSYIERIIRTVREKRRASRDRLTALKFYAAEIRKNPDVRQVYATGSAVQAWRDCRKSDADLLVVTRNGSRPVFRLTRIAQQLLKQKGVLFEMRNGNVKFPNHVDTTVCTENGFRNPVVGTKLRSMRRNGKRLR